MIIRRVEFWNYANIEHYATCFDPEFVFLEGETAEVVMIAAGVLTGYPLLRSSFGRRGARKGTRIHGVVQVKEREYSLWCVWDFRKKAFSYFEEQPDGTMLPSERLYESLYPSREEQDISHFFERNKREFIGKMKKYQKPDNYYYRGEFERLTNGSGGTRTFRAYTRNFLRNNGPEPEGGRNEKPVNEEFEAFLKINAFWTGFEKMRDLNYEPGPLFIEFVDPDPELLKQMDDLGRQVIWKMDAPKTVH
ncbi:MAG: hypothetical protein IKF90_08875 [Parasporobacterium sp.]|nr:hypothetical protein [Parasporobacterium sp.]